MNQEVILQALQSQLVTVKAAAVDHEKSVCVPAIAKLSEKIAKYFADGVITGISKVTVLSDNIILYPNADADEYYNRVTLTYRSNWRGENAYVELDTYRPDMKSNKDNTETLFYYETVAAVAKCFHTISKEYISKWQPAYAKLSYAKQEQYRKIYDIEREIRNIESEIAESAKEQYNKVGVTCELKDYTSHAWNSDNVTIKKTDKHSIKAQYGRARWDYYYINSFKVIDFPKAKHGKVILEYKGSNDEKTHTATLSKARYADFINDVYAWQSVGAAERESYVDERIAREAARKQVA